RIGHDAVGAEFGVHVDGLDQSLSLEIPHRYRTTAGKAMAGLDVDRCPVRSRIGNLTHRRKFVEIENRYAAWKWLIALYGAPGNIQPASIGVRLDVVEPPKSAYLGCLQHLVWPRRCGFLRGSGYGNDYKPA